MGHAGLYIAVTLLVDGLAGLAGGLLSERWLLRHQAALVGFAAGAMLAAVFLNVLPEAQASLGQAALLFTFGGFVALALVEWAVGPHHAVDGRARPRTLPVSLLASDALHNVGDGAAVAAAFLVSPRAGLAVAVAVIAHEVPQEVGDYAVLRSVGLSRLRALVALGVVQLSAVVGAVGVLLTAAHVERLTPAILAVAAGTFLYIGATDLLPQVQGAGPPGDRRERIAGFLGGIVVVTLSLTVAQLAA